MRGHAPHWIDPRDKNNHFPDVEQALAEPDGLLAIGGDLSPERLEAAYRQGIFPWYNQGQPILWWAPNPRTVLFPEQLKISRSLNKTLRKQTFNITADTAFDTVVRACSAPRANETSTWITEEMHQAYTALHHRGLAHSVEAWRQGELVGGLYGIAIGRVFFGESMFSRRSDASKVALVRLVQQLQLWQFAVIDCQIHSQHLQRLGAERIHRGAFRALLLQHCSASAPTSPWQFDPIPSTTQGDSSAHDR